VDILRDDLLPGIVTQVSPSGRLFPDHQAELVAASRNASDCG
jgi:hypothetical protein